MIDAHCHLESLEKDGDLQNVLDRATAAGVTQILVAGDALEDSRANLALAHSHVGVFATVGWHPHQGALPPQAVIEEYRSLGQHDPDVIGIGEIGCDTYVHEGYAPIPIVVQREGFACMMQLAADCHLPVVIHARDASTEILAIMDDFPTVAGMMHCFQGDHRFADACLARGYVLSFSGMVTFKSAHVLREVAQMVPLTSIAIETDAPFLSPVPHRGTRNEPSHVMDTARYLADVLDISVSELEAITTMTVQECFGIDPLQVLLPKPKVVHL